MRGSEGALQIERLIWVVVSLLDELMGISSNYIDIPIGISSNYIDSFGNTNVSTNKFLTQR
jgi:hypothetical protein